MNSTVVLSPFTDSTKVTLLRRVSSDCILSLWRDRFGIDVESELKGVSAVELYRCNLTGVEFFWPPTVAGSGELYEKLGRLDGYYLESKWEYGTALKDLRGCSRVLEIGCGQGGFVRRMNEELSIRGEGIEMNPKAAADAKQRGLLVQISALEDYAIHHKREYDAVCCFQVLEHVPNPMAFLRDCTELVRPGGKVIVSVPNCRSFLRLDRMDPLNMPPHHITLWNSHAIRRVTRMVGLNVVRLRFEPLARYHVDYYIRMHTTSEPTTNWYDWARNRVMHRVGKQGLRRIPALRWLIRGHTLYGCFVRLAV